MPNHFQLGHVEVAKFRHQLDRSHILQLTFGSIFSRRHLWQTGHAQFVFAHGLIQPLAQQAIHDFGAHLAAITLLNHLGRHLAWAKALDAHVVRDFAQAAADLRFDVACGQAEDDAALEVAGGFDRDLHDAMTPGRACHSPVAGTKGWTGAAWPRGTY